jgi:hypothetical protein
VSTGPQEVRESQGPIGEKSPICYFVCSIA